MSKLMFVCSMCGFTAFVDSKYFAQAAGWLFEARPDGTEHICCPACRTDGACDSPADAPAKSRSAGT